MNFRLFSLVVLLNAITSVSCMELSDGSLVVSYNRNCSGLSYCNYNGFCRNDGTCQCFSGYYTQFPDKPCSYSQKKQLTAFLLQFFLGVFGAGHFYI